MFKSLFFYHQASSLQNVALLGTATQSSLSSVGLASNAIDGNRNPEWTAGSCTHTEDGPDHWWSLLLPERYSITHVNITNRSVFASRINNAELLIGNSRENNGNNNPRCSVITSIPASGTRTYNCSGMIGQLVNVKLFDAPRSVLTICELEVYGASCFFGWLIQLA
uniref:Fucolectin tachylectin-4 pentraxin-1 domain-containing protein n=1 Tax=Labrus bergylta TaxID=56723 RepID=A0A3Q3EW85_9LABR